MIEYKTGDIMNEQAEALVNTVNCVGVMGRGIALQFKKRYPENFKVYETACKRGDVQPGHMLVFTTNNVTNPRYIINFPTKRHWRGKSHVSDIKVGLQALRSEIEVRHIRSVALPPLGSGLGGLNWSDVKPLITQALGKMPDVQITVFEPNGAPAPEHISYSKDVPVMKTGTATLVGLMDRYLSALMDPFVTLLEVHKLMYFMQEAGEPLKLKYVKGHYGPYAENLRQVLSRIEGHYVSGYADGGDSPDKKLELVPGATKDAAAFLDQHPDTNARFDRVANLVEGFETPFGLELLSTVHWVATHTTNPSSDDVVAMTYAWGKSKRQFSERQIRLSLDVLTNKGWLSCSDGGPRL